MGVSWMQPWLSRSAFLGQVSAQQAGATEQGGHAQVTILRSLAYASPCSGYGRPGLLDLISRVMWPAKASLPMPDILGGSVLPCTSGQVKRSCGLVCLAKSRQHSMRHHDSCPGLSPYKACFQERVSVVDPLPLVKARIEVPPTSVAPVVEQQAAPPPAAALEAPAAVHKGQEANASIEPSRPQPSRDRS